jgi:serine/threonine protein kinase
MIKKMLTYNPDERISAQESLNDEWLQMQSGVKEEDREEQFHSPLMLNIVENLKRINVSSCVE